MAEIRIFHTHIEVYPYKKGDCPQLERMLSKKVTVTIRPYRYRYEQFAFYIQNDILYIPRGVNTSQLQSWFRTDPTVVYEPDPFAKIKKGSPKLKPKNQLQSDAIDFLVGRNDFTYTARYPQLSLNLETGAGKTYAAIYAVLTLKMRAIMVTHRGAIRTIWYKSLLEKTSMTEDQICLISGSDMIDDVINGKVKADFYLASHTAISDYASAHGWHRIREFFQAAKIGIKIIDEAHRHFGDTLLIDSFTNTAKTFYLTATFGRGDKSEREVYKRSLSSAVRFGETESKKALRRHIKAVIVYFQSSPKYGYIPNLEGRLGFSIHKYIDYELDKSNGELQHLIQWIIQETKSLEGRVLITTPKIDSSERIYRWLKDEGYDAGIINSHHKSSDNDVVMEEAEYISATVRGFSDGLDVSKLRVIINAEPIGNPITINQLAGRLREYAPDKDTYFYHLVDLSIPKCSKWLDSIKKELMTKCKEVIYINADELMHAGGI